MPATTDTTIDLNAEDILIEKQLKEAQERIAYLKAQVAKERKLRLQIKKSGSTSTTTTSNALNKEDQQISAVQSSLEKTLLTTSSMESAPELHPATTRQRPSTSGGGSKHQHNGIGSNPLTTSHSQPSGLGRPQTSGSSSRKKLGKLKTPTRRPKTASASAHQKTSLARLSPSRSRASERHTEQAKNMSYKRLQELLNDRLFQEAIKRKGCQDTQLHPRRLESFRRQSNRAALLSLNVARLNFEAYETTRVLLLAMVSSDNNKRKERLRCVQGGDMEWD